MLKPLLFPLLLVSAISAPAFGQQTSNPLGDLLAQQRQNQTSQGLTMDQLNDMSKHPDEHLIENLRQHNFSAISDERWSRFNQWGLLLQIDHCVLKNKDAATNEKLANDKEIRDAYQSMMTPVLAVFPYGAYYFLKEDPNGAAIIDSNFLMGPSAEERKIYYSTKLGLPLNCNDPSVEAIAKNLAELYIERTRADAARGSQAEDVVPAKPGESLWHFNLTTVSRAELKRVWLTKHDRGNSQRQFEQIMTGIDQDREKLDIAAEVRHSHELDAFVAQEKATSCSTTPYYCDQELRVLATDQAGMSQGIEQMRQFLVKSGQGVPTNLQLPSPPPPRNPFPPHAPPTWISAYTSAFQAMDLPKEDSDSLVSSLNAISEGFTQGNLALVRSTWAKTQTLANRYASACARTNSETTCKARNELIHLNAQIEVALMSAH